MMGAETTAGGLTMWKIIKSACHCAMRANPFGSCVVTWHGGTKGVEIAGLWHNAASVVLIWISQQ